MSYTHLQKPSYRSRVTAYFLWAFFLVGLCGLHRLYLGKRSTGWLWLLTFGLFGFGTLYDFLVLHNLVREANVADLPVRPRPRNVVLFAPSITHNHPVEIRTRVKCGYCGTVSPDGVQKCPNCGVCLAA